MSRNYNCIAVVHVALICSLVGWLYTGRVPFAIRGTHHSVIPPPPQETSYTFRCACAIPRFDGAIAQWINVSCYDSDVSPYAPLDRRSKVGVLRKAVALWRCRYPYRLLAYPSEEDWCAKQAMGIERNRFTVRALYPALLNMAPSGSLFVDLGANTGQVLRTILCCFVRFGAFY